MIAAFQKDAALLADFAKPLDEGALRIWWLGQSGFLLKCDDATLLFDPYLSDSLTRKYAETDKPHVRLTELVVAPATLAGVQVVTSSHNHTDHLDAETLLALREANPGLTLVIPEANRDFVAERLGCDPAWPIGLDDARSVTVAGWEIHGVPAAHEQIDQDAEGRHRYLGYIARRGGWTIYHSGDTMLYPGMVEKLRSFAIDIAILPINGRSPERRVAGNLNGIEAAQLAHDIGARVVIPCHYGMFGFNTADPADTFLPECQRLNQPCLVMQNGEGHTFPAPTGGNPR